MSIKEIPLCIVYKVFNLITYDFAVLYICIINVIQIPIFTTILRRYSKGTI